MTDYLRHLKEQPEVLLNNLKDYLDGCHPIGKIFHEKSGVKSYGQVVFTGMGASYFSVLPAAFFLQSNGVRATVEETGVLQHYMIRTLNRETILVVVSRSGESVEIKRLLEKINIKNGPLVIAITENKNSFLAVHAHHVLLTSAGDDPPIAMKTYTSSMALLFLLAVELSGSDIGYWKQKTEDTISCMHDFLEEQERNNVIQIALEYLGDFNHLTLLGRGVSYTSALEGALLFQEGARKMATGYSGWQFRHGGVEVVEEGFCSVLFAPPGSTLKLQENLAGELVSYGGKVVIIGNGNGGWPGHILKVNTPHEFLAPLVEILPVQFMVYLLAKAQGIPIGKFRNASNIVTIE